jgi:hypothetical protein
MDLRDLPRAQRPTYSGASARNRQAEASLTQLDADHRQLAALDFDREKLRKTFPTRREAEAWR